MSGVGQLSQQLQQELQNELITANQLLRLISVELQQIKHFTSAGGEFEENISKNAAVMKSLASLQHIDIKNLPPIVRNAPTNKIPQERIAPRNESEMDRSQ